MLAAALPLFATDDDTAAAPAAEPPAGDAVPNDAAAQPAAASEVAPLDAPVSETTATTDAPSTAAPVQTPTPVAQSGSAGDPVLETVKTPAHNVADEIQAAIEKIEELPEEVAAWFKSKFVELASHIKALL